MQYQIKTFAQSNYSESDYNTNTYNIGTSQDTAQPDNNGILPNTGQDVLLVVGLGLILIAVSLFSLLRRKKHNKSPKSGLNL